ncbi:hypothetical protein FRACYDRAFT_251907 [Fragilariopsis cylindrus CCMP1102]|uniref:Uncharacterized protein n=1 Tax=Fragilariopsis cylindrus CCMP1102 TaxID=635003 RepID=A0A1E7EMH0_9STRA|nr:hypothetical protein FRACYDRAFT_251907 [Fragilariopsis cylindrus CCMP1102]|eukprot:OEU07128.1 hypothetical protein FRACYDRAFT_251907 [Fragilariopsis cylindrus CCMP1102]
MYNVPIRGYNLSLICLGWIPGPDFGVLGIWVLKPWSNSFFLMVWQPISEWYCWAWKHDILAEMQCFCSGAKNKYCTTDLTSTTAFTTSSRSARITTRRVLPVITDMPSYTSTSTSLNLKIKVDPNAKTDNSKGNAKGAAYVGSIAIAAALPIIFLIWSATNK